MTKEEFNKLWKDSTKEEILNQYYYDYKELQRTNNIINGMEKFFKYELEEEVRPLNDFKVSVWTICLDKLQELKGDSSNE